MFPISKTHQLCLYVVKHGFSLLIPEKAHAACAVYVCYNTDMSGNCLHLHGVKRCWGVTRVISTLSQVN